MDLGEIKKAANFLVVVKLKVMDDNVCKLHIGPRAEAARSLTHFFAVVAFNKRRIGFHNRQQLKLFYFLRRIWQEPT